MADKAPRVKAEWETDSWAVKCVIRHSDGCSAGLLGGADPALRMDENGERLERQLAVALEDRKGFLRVAI